MIQSSVNNVKVRLVLLTFGQGQEYRWSQTFGQPVVTTDADNHLGWLRTAVGHSTTETIDTHDVQLR